MFTRLQVNTCTPAQASKLRGICSWCNRTAQGREGRFYWLVVTSPSPHTLVKGASANEAMHRQTHY